MQQVNQDVLPFALGPNAAEDWTGGSKWEPGAYTFEFKGIEVAARDDGALFAKCKCLTTPEGQEGRVGQIYSERFQATTDGENPAINFFFSFLARITPGGFLNDPEKTSQAQDGQRYPIMSWAHGGPNGRGAEFSAMLVEDTYPARRGKNKGKDVKVTRFDRGSVQLIRPSSYYLERRGSQPQQAAQQQQPPPAAGWGEAAQQPVQPQQPVQLQQAAPVQQATPVQPTSWNGPAV